MKVITQSMRQGILAVLVAGLCCVLSAANAATLINVWPVPGSDTTAVRAINDSNVITGTYTVPGDYYLHGFVGTLSGNYTTFDYRPKADGIDTKPQTIDNNGDVGGYAEVHSTGRRYSFIRHTDGTITTITKNGRPLDSALWGLSSDGQSFVGNHFSRSLVGHGDAYQSYIHLPFDNVFAPLAEGINSSGDIVGYYESCDGCSVHGHAFLIRNGVAAEVDLPKPRVGITELYAINDNGIATGEGIEQTDPNTAYEYPFFYDSNTQVFTRLSGIFPRGINNLGLMAAEYNGHPFIYCPFSVRKCSKIGAVAMHVTEIRIPASAHNAGAILCSRACRESSTRPR
jgi:hypothetical protein